MRGGSGGSAGALRAPAARGADGTIARLESQVRELRAALEDAAEAICRIDTEGHVVTINRSFTRLSGYAAEDIVGRSWEVTVAAADRALMKTEMRTATDKFEREVHGVRN